MSIDVDENEIKKAWVRRVKELMPKKGFQTYQNLAYEAGVSVGSLNQAMRGMHLPRQTTIEKIAKALNTTPQFLLYGDTLKATKTVPFLNDAKQVFDWVYGYEDVLGQSRVIEVESDLDISQEAFAWTSDSHDMEPAFCSGDLLVIDPSLVEDVSIFTSQTPRYVLSLKFSKPEAKPEDLILGRVLKTVDGFYISPVNDRFPSVRVEKNIKMVGLVVKMTRFFIENPAILINS